MQFWNFKVLLAFLLNFVIYCCNFQSYTDALVPDETQFFSEEYYVNIQEQYGNSFAFGFWMFQQPYPKSQKLLAQTIFQVTTKSDEILFFERVLGGTQQFFTLQFILFEYKQQLYYQFYEFQNQWIFTLFTIVPSQKKIYMQISGRNVYSFLYRENINQQTLIFTAGNYNQNPLNQFQGKISKILFFIDFYYDETTFEKFSQQCKIPNPVNGSQTVQISDYLEQFENQNSLLSTIYVYGNRYSLSGWVKYDSNLVSYYIQSQLVRITRNHLKQQQKVFGDDLFKLEVNFSNSNQINSKIKITIDCFCKLNYNNGCKYLQQDSSSTYYEYNLTDTTSDVFYNSLLQWHYFQYEYGRTDYKNELMLFSIYFTHSQELIQKQFGDPASFSFVNEYFYIFVGEKIVNYNTLTAKIFDLQFQYYYDQDLNFKIICHPTCQDCNGPLSNNCLSCKQNLNRVLSEEINQCECQKDYFQFEDEVQCRRIEDSSITVSSIEKKDSKFCQFGQFYYPLSNGEHYCFQCPQFKQNQYHCANCLFNPLNWYLEPICSIDLLYRGKYEDDAYYIIDRNSVQIDIYFIDNFMNLNLIFGSESFCDPLKVQDCYFINQTYLGKQIAIKCKNGFIFSDYQCTKQQTDSNIIIFQQSKDKNCSNGMFLFQNQCYECPIQCINCYYNNIKKQVICNICQQGYTISNNTCVKCATNCKICEEVYDLELKTNYIKCLKCIDDSLYYLSIYGISCNKNDIPGCKYAVQYKKEFIIGNSYFPTKEKVLTLCAYCSLFSDYNYLSNSCKNSTDIYTEQTICHKRIISQSLFLCTLSASSAISNSFYINCKNYIFNCNQCQRSIDYSFYICIQCLPGYYANRLNGQCDVCPRILLEQNCNECGQQQKKSQDYWTYQLRPFYRQFLELADTYEYITHGQSQYQNDYEIICTNCITGYVLHNGGCIKDCPDNCKECELQNDQYKCVRCEKSLSGRSLTLFNNECIQCSEYCALCRKRTDQEINQINPLFNSTEFLEFSYQCLKSYDDDQYQYDSELGQFIKCEIEANNCENQLQIDLNLYCDSNQYEMDLNSFSNEQEKIDFLNKNILISDLFSNNSFKQFEDNLFFWKANVRKIKSIIINISSNYDLFCDIGKNAMITQKFGLNIFSVLNVTLNLSFSFPTVFQFEGTFIIENFNQLYLKGIQFQPKFINILNSQISLISVYPQTISLCNIIYESISQEYNQQSIQIDNLKDLKIKNFQLQNININNTTGFMKIFKNSIEKQIFISNCTIKDGQFQNSIIFYFELNENDEIIFEKVSVRSNFFHSSLILIEKEQMSNQYSQHGYFILKEVDLSINLKNTIYFIDIEGVKQFSIQQIKLSNSTLIQSQLLSSCTNNIIEDALFQNIKLNRSSTLIVNSDFQVSKNVNYDYQSIIFSNIEYDGSSHFIKLQKQNTQNQTLSINQIKLLNNFCNHKIENQSNLTNSLLYLNLNYVSIQNLEIIKMYGITELSIYDTIKFNLKSTYMQSQKKFENVGLHKYLECFINRMQDIQFSETIIIYSSRDIIIENLNINNAFFHNSPFLLIKSADLELVTQQERIQMNNLKLQNNLIIQTDGQSQVSLIQITSSQTVQIEINEIQFVNNILHQYYQNNLKTSATLINIDCELCIFYLIKSLVINNTVTNGTDSIIFVNVKEISLQNVIFDSNSVFLYELIQPYLFWEFEYDQEIYLENMEEVFPIKSTTGNGWFIAQKINIIDNKISNSKGREGGGFRLQGKGNSQISVTNLKLDRISTFFQTKEEYGGALYFDGQNAQKLEINIYNVQANEVFWKNQGGLFFIQIGNIQSRISIKHITFFENFALKGSLAYINFFFQSSFEQNLYIKQVKGQNTEAGLKKFFLSFKNLQNEDVYAYANDRNLFFIESGSKMMIESFMIYSSFCESLLYQNNGKNVGLKYISVLNSSICNQFFSVNFIENEQTQFQLSDSNFQNLTFKSQISQHKCNQDTIKVPQIQFFCSSEYYNAPKQIKKYQIKQDQNNFFICILNQINLNPLGFMILNGLTSYSQIILQNLEINSIICENCLYGIIYFNIKSPTLKQNSIMIINIDLLNSNCGNSSCIYSKVFFMNSDRILMSSQQQILQFQLKIQNYKCQHNTGYIGTCLLIDQISTSIQNSIFQFNNSTLSGGALLVRGKQQFFLENCIITQNQAFIGGGIYLEDQQALSFSYFKVQLNENYASNFGNDFFNPPEKLSIIMNNSGKTMKNQTYQIDEIQNNGQNEKLNFIYLPSGQQINKFEQFSITKKTYQILNLSLYLVALQSDNTITKDLEYSSCQILSRKYDSNKNDKDQLFTNNYTNMNNVFYDTFTNSYNLDELILYFSIDNQTNEILQLQFECDSIFVPNFNQTYPYNFIDSHQNYKLRINIKTYPCQLGEIQNQTAQYFQKCDANLGFFSLQLASNKCELKDEITTLEVKSAQLNLRLGYWRPYFDTSFVDFCINLPTNCLGGWIEGDIIKINYNSCIDGHIGALCEQCDLYNIRGDGNFYENEKFKCSNCTGNYLNIVVIVMISIWTFFTIYIAVNSNVKIQIEYTKLQPFNRLKLARNLNKTQSGALIKMFTGYFQIISSITTFRESFPYTFVNTTNTIGMPISTMVQSQDCFIHELFDIEIHYSKVIWLILLELAYMIQFSFLFYLGTFCKWFKNYQTIMITMLLYIYIYFQPDIIGSLVSLLSYREISGYKWIQANLAYRYDTIQHFNWMIRFCLPIIFIFAFLIPFCLFLNLYKQQKNLENRQIRKKYGFLYHEYQNYAYFWEIVKIIEKQFIIFLQRFYEDQIVLKGIFILSISYFYQLLNSHYKPYYLKNLNQLDYYAANICLISFSFTKVLIIQLIFLILVIFLNIVFTFYLLSKILEDYLKNIDNNLDQILIYIKSNIKFILKFDFIKRFLINRLAKKKRVNYLINRFKSKALSLAKNSIQAKKQISQTWKSSLESNCGIENLILNETKRRSLIFCSVEYSSQLRNSKQNMQK